MKKKNIILIATAILIISVACVYVSTKNNKKNVDQQPAPVNNEQTQIIDSTKTEQPIEAKFICKDNKIIQARFDNKEDIVDLVLSDGRNLKLPRAISASGARYANQEETLVFWNKGDTTFLEESGTSTFANCFTQSDNQAGLANPASTNCQDKGGKVVIEKKDDGSEYGLCYFDDNRACEEWAMLRGDCPIGGRKTTGYDTIAQKFCAWSGGKTLATENAVCTFGDGSTCLADDFYKGTCEPKKLVD
ncbi:MAG: DUF333 domain-containing protein [Patescibacteria group bacterium]|nr:DUF333 domain-containing protein [Patescibacteria group bacterium]